MVKANTLQSHFQQLTKITCQGRTLAPDAENQLAFSAENRLAPDASLLTSTTCTTSTTRTKSTAFSTSTTQKH